MNSFFLVVLVCMLGGGVLVSVCSGVPSMVMAQLIQTADEKKIVPIKIGEKTLRAVISDSEKTLTEGLLGWDTITEDQGMLLDFSSPGQYAIHMQGMKFPIDAVWIDSRGEIKLIYEKIQPNSGRVYPSIYSCRYCLEVKAGFCERQGVKEGGKVIIDAR